MMDDQDLTELIRLICNFVDAWGRRPTASEILEIWAYESPA